MISERQPMAERFADYLHRRAAPIWEAQQQHPFVRGIGDGTLDVEKFKHWVRQDYLFLIEYCRLFGLAAGRAPDLETIGRFADLLRVAATGDFAELAAALLPCMWGFSEIGRTLQVRGLPPEPRYAKWIETYA